MCSPLWCLLPSARQREGWTRSDISARSAATGSHASAESLYSLKLSVEAIASDRQLRAIGLNRYRDSALFEVSNLLIGKS